MQPKRSTSSPRPLSGFYIFGDYCTGQLWTLVK